jgi:hypothetical protein
MRPGRDFKLQVSLLGVRAPPLCSYYYHLAPAMYSTVVESLCAGTYHLDQGSCQCANGIERCGIGTIDQAV